MNLLRVILIAAAHKQLKRRYPLWFDAQQILAGIDLAFAEDGYE